MGTPCGPAQRTLAKLGHLLRAIFLLAVHPEHILSPSPPFFSSDAEIFMLVTVKNITLSNPTLVGLIGLDFLKERK